MFWFLLGRASAGARQPRRYWSAGRVLAVLLAVAFAIYWWYVAIPVIVLSAIALTIYGAKQGQGARERRRISRLPPPPAHWSDRR